MTRSLILPVCFLTVSLLTACGTDPDAATDADDAMEEPVGQDDPSPGAPVGSRDGSGKDAGGKDAGAKDASASDVTHEPATAGKALLPFATGNTWTYKVTGDGETFMKVTTVGAEEPVGIGPHASKLAFKVVTKKAAEDQTVSWQAVEGDRVVRYREQAFQQSTGKLEAEEWWSPAKLHIDGSPEHTAAGATWVETYQETKQNVGEAEESAPARDPWAVDGVDQMVTVPAGTFRAVVFTKSGGSNMKTYWYVAGIGKVKETGGQTEELVSYEVRP